MYKRILVPIDGSATSLRGLDEAIKLAKHTGATLDLVHVVDESITGVSYAPAGDYEWLFESLREVGRNVLAEAEVVTRKQGVAFQSQMLESVRGPAADWIVSQAKQWSADLIVMGTHGRRGLRRLVMGSDAELILRSSPVPVLLVRSESS
jgi:nucleotide-binding universal stress UspA family protein